MQSALPAELYDNIIDHLHDRKTLHASALVCRDWLPSARHHLFYTITLTTANIISAKKFFSDQNNAIVGTFRRMVMFDYVARDYSQTDSIEQILQLLP